MAVVTVFVVLLASLLIARVGAVALTLAGMSHESSRFQARSAFFAVGFTTAEAEAVVGHPVRRRIIAWLILLGSAGVISILGSLVISFGGERDTLGHVGILLGGLVVVDLEVRDYAAVLELEGGYAVAELLVEPQDWIAGRCLGAVTLRDEGVVVLGVHRQGGAYLGAPDGDTVVERGVSIAGVRSEGMPEGAGTGARPSVRVPSWAPASIGRSRCSSRIASTTSTSNWRPAHARNSLSASATGIAGR
jgi:hypothetical protein